MAKARTRQVRCKICFHETPLLSANPPFGTHLVCENCRTPLVGTVAADGTMLTVTPDYLRQITGFTGRSLIHPFCPWCGAINHAVVVPAEGRATAWSAQKEPQSAKSFAVTTQCVQCEQDFCIEWDAAPLPSECALCRKNLRTGKRFETDPRFCIECGPKLTQVRARRKKDAPPGSAIELILLVGFSRMPKPAEAKALRKLDKEISEEPLVELMVSGGVPTTKIETALITVDLASSSYRKATGRAVDLEKVTYQGFRGMLVIKIWK